MRHAEDDPALGQPPCPDCYDYVSHGIWQWCAPDLWRRVTITLRRLVAKRLGVPVTRLGDVATVQYAKVAEYQLRGVAHFHALVRLDGPRTPDGFAPAPATLHTGTLADLIQQAAAGRALSPGQVAGYLAKYATKSVTDTTDPDRRRQPPPQADPGDHPPPRTTRQDRRCHHSQQHGNQERGNRERGN